MKIAIYSDDAPISEELLAAGLSRINVRLFKALSENISTIMVSYESRYFTKNDLAADLSSKIVFMKMNYFFVKTIKKLTISLEKLTGKYIDILFTLFLSKILNTIRDSNSDWLFIPLGANIRAYRRAIEISRKSQLPLAVFIGDEFKNYAILSKNKNSINMCEKYLNQWLRETSKIFVISQGMKTFLFNEYGVESVVLNLPYEKKYDVNSLNRSNAVFFLGNASHFYHDGLVEMIDVIYAYNEKFNTNIYLRFTIDILPDIFKQHHMKYIKYGKIDTDYNSSKEISEALFCYVPTSFDEKYKVMVSTSFPSKLMECLAFAKDILVYGPKYSSSLNYFEENKLNSCISIRDKKELYDFLDKKYLKNDNYSKEYNEILEKNHNLKNLKNNVLKSLNV